MREAMFLASEVFPDPGIPLTATSRRALSGNVWHLPGATVSGEAYVGLCGCVGAATHPISCRRGDRPACP